MAKAIIKLAYQQIIDNYATGAFERKVFDDSYREFLLKIQTYNQEGKYTTYSEIVANDGRANSLHYKVSFAVLHHVETLKGKIPGLYDNAGRTQVPFDIPEFKLLESGITDKSLHTIAVIYMTPAFTLLDSFGEYMVLSPIDQDDKEEPETFVLRMQPGLSIVRYAEQPEEENVKSRV